MNYKFDRIRDAVQKDLKAASEAVSFLELVQTVSDGEIVQSGDRIRFTTANKLFRFVDEAAAERDIELIELFFEDRSPAPKITRYG